MPRCRIEREGFDGNFVRSKLNFANRGSIAVKRKIQMCFEQSRPYINDVE